MRLVNYQEDLVLHVAEIVLQERPDVKLTQELLLDTAAYVLNRLPPRYIVSERGFTRLLADCMVDGDDEKLGGLVELLVLINNAVDLVKRRRSPVAANEALPVDAEAEDHLEPHWHNMPYLIGRVVDEESGKPVPGAQISLLVDGERVSQAGSGWTNPYTTSDAGQGFYSFLPVAVHSEESARKFNVQIVIEVDGYERHSLERTVKTKGELAARVDFRYDGFIDLGTTRLRKNGR